jgi:hypothetical protein
VVSRWEEEAIAGQVVFTVSQSPVLAVGFRQLLAPSVLPWSTHGIQLMSTHAYTPKDSSQLVLPTAHSVQFARVEDPAREYGRRAPHLEQAVTLPVELL